MLRLPASFLWQSAPNRVMPYWLKLFLYVLPWYIVGAVVGSGWLRDSNRFIVFGIARLMAVAMILSGSCFDGLR